MALNWDLSGIKNYKKLYRTLKEGEEGYEQGEKRKRLKQPYEQIIWHTMSVGIRHITDKNWEQFYNRVRMYEMVVGTRYFKRTGKKLIPIYTTKEDVQKMIGLKTNVSTMTKNKFTNQLLKFGEQHGFKI